ncbi:hypothetical protein [Microbacterium sp.]|uniref:hypothetical protein n=1 Tax=Microbacterium sp. TaxID=51671 RepID=UPI00273748BB|nr:hypothetical protein [Microbacterium sp.]MDP3951884.1 hypothetical protein [Microbacterium sp.]
MVNNVIKIIGTVTTIALLVGCAPTHSDPKQSAAAAWLATGNTGAGCPLAHAATSPMRDDLELAAPQFDFTGSDGVGHWKVRATGDGYDRLVIVREDSSGNLCVATDSVLR